MLGMAMHKKPLRILLVEDDGSIARIIMIAMRDIGVPYAIDQAFSAEEGLELWDQQPYDIVLTDYNLRGMNGIAMIAALRSARRGRPADRAVYRLRRRAYPEGSPRRRRHPLCHQTIRDRRIRQAHPRAAADQCERDRLPACA